MLLKSVLDCVASVASLPHHFELSEIKPTTQRKARSAVPRAALHNLGRRKIFNSVGKRDQLPVVRGKKSYQTNVNPKPEEDLGSDV